MPMMRRIMPLLRAAVYAPCHAIISLMPRLITPPFYYAIDADFAALYYSPVMPRFHYACYAIICRHYFALLSAVSFFAMPMRCAAIFSFSPLLLPLRHFAAYAAAADD